MFDKNVMFLSKESHPEYLKNSQPSVFNEENGNSQSWHQDCLYITMKRQ